MLLKRPASGLAPPLPAPLHLSDPSVCVPLLKLIGSLVRVLRGSLARLHVQPVSAHLLQQQLPVQLLGLQHLNLLLSHWHLLLPLLLPSCTKHLAICRLTVTQGRVTVLMPQR